RPPKTETLAEGFRRRLEVPLRRRLVNNDYLGRLAISPLLESAAGEKRNLKRAKIITGDGGEARIMCLGHRKRAALGNESAANGVVARPQRQIDPAARGLHTGRRLEPFHELSEKFRSLLVFVFRAGQCDGRDENMVRVKAGTDLLEEQKAFDQETSADEQNERQRDFADQQQAARTGAAMTFASSTTFFK